MKQYSHWLLSGKPRAHFPFLLLELAATAETSRCWWTGSSLQVTERSHHLSFLLTLKPFSNFIWTMSQFLFLQPVFIETCKNTLVMSYFSCTRCSAVLLILKGAFKFLFHSAQMYYNTFYFPHSFFDAVFSRNTRNVNTFFSSLYS